ncbi:putative methyltransferase type 11 [Seiridium unicorne]|uniref:Methyltransferase type 11 n=1 Tax=Seiridium unicorne TaxID=138068 RepID=A0ABR2UWI1_9PEZI
MVARQLIVDWVESVEPPTSLQTNKRSRQRSTSPTEPPAKRKRISADYQAGDTTTMPSTPPQTDPDVLIPLRESRKRGQDDQDAADINTTPKASASASSRSEPQAKGAPAQKRVKFLPIKTIDGLGLLEKPITITTFDNDPVLPEDVRSLYRDIRRASNQIGILPSEIRTELERESKDELFDHFFRAPLPIQAGESTVQARMRMLERHSLICRIQQAAVASERLHRREFGWNNHVHTPLLELVFGSIPFEPQRTQQPPQRVATRVEAVMSATIAGNSVPSIRPQDPYQGPWPLAASVSLNSSARNSEEDLEDTELVKADGLDQVHSRSRSRKVDYVVVLDIAETEPLHSVIRNASFEEATGKLHVNQTEYPSVALSPIAVSIETKASVDDARVQLGIWIAAWHKRMYDLRARASKARIASWTRPDAASPFLVSTPQILVERHRWELYFACDQGQRIELIGPVHLGTTSSLIGTYALVSCLEAAQSWIETVFLQQIKAWFK